MRARAEQRVLHDHISWVQSAVYITCATDCPLRSRVQHHIDKNFSQGATSQNTWLLGAKSEDCYTLVGGCRTIAASLTFIASGEPPAVIVWGGLLVGVEQYIASPGWCRTPTPSILGVFRPVLSNSLFSL